MTKSSRVTLRDIAEATGITRMAVSMALRGKPGVSEETRGKVLAAAEKLGYIPDPEVAKLLSRIRTRTPSESRSCIALLTSGDTPDEWKKFVTERKYVEGAQARAKEYGYRIEEFWLGQPGVTPSRLSSIIWNRGIEGVIIAPLQGKLSGGKIRSIQLDYSLFSVVEISETVDWPDLDRSMHDQYTAMLKCLDELRELNYRRIGLVIEEALDLRVNGKWTAAFLRHREHHKADKMPPPLLLPAHDEKRFDRWFTQHQPDVIISVDQFALRLMQKRGCRIPEQVGYASMDLDGDASSSLTISGIDQNSRMVGASAVDLLVASIHRGQRGIPVCPVRIEVEGAWRAGQTTMRQNGTKAANRPK